MVNQVCLGMNSFFFFFLVGQRTVSGCLSERIPLSSLVGSSAFPITSLLYRKSTLPDTSGSSLSSDFLYFSGSCPGIWRGLIDAQDKFSNLVLLEVK